MASGKKAAGALGEEFAAAYLQKHHYKIIRRNFSIRNGEIDIIAIDYSEQPAVLAFIEVKTRSSFDYGLPLESIGYYKLSALKRTAAFYKMSHQGLPDAMRLDAVAVLLDSDNRLASLELVKNIG